MRINHDIANAYANKTNAELLSKPTTSPVRKIKTPHAKYDTIPTEHLPSSLKAVYKLNEDKFQEFQGNLREHQKDSLRAVSEALIGQINLPTGTGKTYVQKHIHIEDMIAKTKANKTGVYVIAAHRLALCTQLFDEILNLLIPCGLKADMIYVGSDRYNFDNLNQKFNSLGFAIAGMNGKQMTSGHRIARKVRESHEKGHHTIIVSTYHSFHRLALLPKIDIVTFDEAHTIPRNMFTDNINLVKPVIERQYFFTATRKVFGEDGGMNDFEFFGEVLHEMSPRRAIELGEIVRPRIHTIRTDDADINEINSENVPMMVKTIIEAFNAHKFKVEYPEYPNLKPEVKRLIKRNLRLISNRCPNLTPQQMPKRKLGTKLLVTVNGLKELHAMHDSEDFRIWCRNNNVNTFAFSSDEGEFTNFNSTGRQQTLESMNQLQDTQDAILFHYDILTEGIDLPAITGVLLLRDLPTTKLLQNIGRGARLLKQDRIKLYAEEIQPHETNKMIKPFCWIIIPEFLATLMGDENMKNMIKTIRETYNIQFELMGEDDQALADQEHFSDRVTSHDSPNRNDQLFDLNHIFEDIIVDEFVEEIALQPIPRDYLEEQLELL